MIKYDKEDLETLKKILEELTKKDEEKKTEGKVIKIKL